MKQLLLATQNHNKVIEIKKILSHLPIDIISLSDLNDDEDVEETGQTFEENAYLKAYHFAQKYQLPTISDDSGLVVDVLGGKPGIYSARYSGLGNHGNNIKLLDEMKDHKNRSAYFISVIVLCYPSGKHQTFEGRVEGLIHDKIEGEQGFGYDPIFYYPPFQTTFGRIPLDQKNLVSHRANALKKLKEALYEDINNK